MSITEMQHVTEARSQLAAALKHIEAIEAPTKSIEAHVRWAQKQLGVVLTTIQDESGNEQKEPRA